MNDEQLIRRIRYHLMIRQQLAQILAPGEAEKVVAHALEIEDDWLQFRPVP